MRCPFRHRPRPTRGAAAVAAAGGGCRARHCRAVAMAACPDRRRWAARWRGSWPWVQALRLPGRGGGRAARAAGHRVPGGQMMFVIGSDDFAKMVRRFCPLGQMIFVPPRRHCPSATDGSKGKKPCPTRGCPATGTRLVDVSAVIDRRRSRHHSMALPPLPIDVPPSPKLLVVVLTTNGKRKLLLMMVEGRCEPGSVPSGFW